MQRDMTGMEFVEGKLRYVIKGYSIGGLMPNGFYITGEATHKYIESGSYGSRTLSLVTPQHNRERNVQNNILIFKLYTHGKVIIYPKGPEDEEAYGGNAVILVPVLMNDKVVSLCLYVVMNIKELL